MKKISILSLHLGYGGIEKCVVNLANSICNDYEVEIISTYKLYNNIPYELNENVKVRYLIEKYKPNREEWKEAVRKFKIFKIIKESYISLVVLTLRKKKTVNAIKNLDSSVVISTRTLFNKWVGKYCKKGIRKIAWEHNHHHGNSKYIDEVVTSCKNMDNLVLVSDSLCEFYKEEMEKYNSKCKCIAIPNSLDIVPDNVSNLIEQRVVSIGRLSREKGFPDLIDVFNIIHQKHENLRLDIIGDGPQRNMVVDKIYEYGLTDYITFHGFQNKQYIDEIMNKSCAYVMTSYTESFGLVLIEAMSYGLPCIAFSSAEGACEIIENDVNGYLIDNRDKEEMANKILEVVKDYGLRKRLGKNARSKSLNYESDNVKDKWLEVIEKR